MSRWLDADLIRIPRVSRFHDRLTIRQKKERLATYAPLLSVVSIPVRGDRREAIWPSLTDPHGSALSGGPLVRENCCRSPCFSPMCSFANPSGRRGSHEQNTNSQFVQAYRLGTQGRDTNARCNQRPPNVDTESAVFLLIRVIDSRWATLRNSVSPSEVGL